MKSSGPKPPRPASTVILTREFQGALQVYLLRRSLTSGFMPGNYVFPGGTIDTQDRDFDFWVNHVDLEPAEVWDRLGGDLTAEEALPYGVAAARETFEEAGVLLVGQDGGVSGGLERLLDHRENDCLGEGWMQEAVKEEGWILLLSSLSPWARWVTPKVRSSRYDTRFFIAPLPHGQKCRPDMREAIHGVWITPEEALAGNLRGDLALSPPTLVSLQELLSCRSFAELKRVVPGGSLWGETRLPRLSLMKKTAVLLLPWDPAYLEESGTIASQSEVLPVGEPFSRLRLEEGIWRPVNI